MITDLNTGYHVNLNSVNGDAMYVWGHLSERSKGALLVRCVCPEDRWDANQDPACIAIHLSSI